jgi:hypothetical protein
LSPIVGRKSKIRGFDKNCQALRQPFSFGEVYQGVTAVGFSADISLLWGPRALCCISLDIVTLSLSSSSFPP